VTAPPAHPRQTSIYVRVKPQLREKLSTRDNTTYERGTDCHKWRFTNATGPDRAAIVRRAYDAPWKEKISRDMLRLVRYYGIDDGLLFGCCLCAQGTSTSGGGEACGGVEWSTPGLGPSDAHGAQAI
jgi:hypothetical protein